MSETYTLKHIRMSPRVCVTCEGPLLDDREYVWSWCNPLNGWLCGKCRRDWMTTLNRLSYND